MVFDRDGLRALIRTIPDFPKAEVQFGDVTLLLLDGAAFADAVVHWPISCPGSLT